MGVIAYIGIAGKIQIETEFLATPFLQVDLDIFSSTKLVLKMWVCGTVSTNFTVDLDMTPSHA